jgi:hypothetical protein
MIDPSQTHTHIPVYPPIPPLSSLSLSLPNKGVVANDSPFLEPTASPLLRAANGTGMTRLKLFEYINKTETSNFHGYGSLSVSTSLLASLAHNFPYFSHIGPFNIYI